MMMNEEEFEAQLRMNHHRKMATEQHTMTHISPSIISNLCLNRQCERDPEQQQQQHALACG